VPILLRKLGKKSKKPATTCVQAELVENVEASPNGKE
jgi:hypothetical protein